MTKPDIELSNLPGFNTVEDILKRDSFVDGTMVRELTFRNRTQEGLFRCDLILCFVPLLSKTAYDVGASKGAGCLVNRQTHQPLTEGAPT